MLSILFEFPSGHNQNGLKVPSTSIAQPRNSHIRFTMHFNALLKFLAFSVILSLLSAVTPVTAVRGALCNVMEVAMPLPEDIPFLSVRNEDRNSN